MKELIPKIPIILAILISFLIWPIVTQAQEFTEQTGISLTGVNNSSAAWGDYDNDGDLDILLTGQETSSGKVLKIYNNNNDNTFSEQSGIDISAIESGSVDWGDYDNDGYLDILITGSIELTNHISRIYKNTGNKSFFQLFS